jgi:hypothetical protein
VLFMGHRTQFFCDVCGKEKSERDIKAFPYARHPDYTQLDVCIGCQYDLVSAALNRTDIVKPRRLCKVCGGKGYVRVPDGCGPYPGHENKSCVACASIHL